MTEYPKCEGCGDEILPSESYLIFGDGLFSKRSGFRRVHDEFGCLCNAVGAAEVRDRPDMEIHCAGCGLEILPDPEEYLVIMRHGKEVRIHNDFICLKNVVGTQRFEALEKRPRYRTVGYEY